MSSPPEDMNEIETDSSQEHDDFSLPSGALQAARAELATKEHIIAEVLQHLQKCMQENSELEIQNEILQRKLTTEQIDSEKLKKTCQWYKTELHNVQKELRVQQLGHNDEKRKWKADQETLRVQLLKSSSDCEILHQRLSLEKAKRCDHVLDDSQSSPRPEWKDSGVFSDSNISDACSDVLEMSLESPAKSSEIDEMKQLKEELDKQKTIYQELKVIHEKDRATLEMWKQKYEVQESLHGVLQRNMDQLKQDNQSSNLAFVNLRKEFDTVVGYLTKCRQQVDQLQRENGEIHKESMTMILKFEKVASVLSEYRQELGEKDDEIQRLLAAAFTKAASLDRSSQTVMTTKYTEQSTQTSIERAAQSSSYYRNLVKVMEREHQHQLKRREGNTRTLLRKLKEELQRVKELERLNSQLEGELTVIRQQVLQTAPSEVIIPSETSSQQATGGQRSLEDQQEVVESIAQLERKCGRFRVLLENLMAHHRKEVEFLVEELNVKKGDLETAEDTVRVLKMEQESLHESLDVLKQKFLEMEQRVLKHAQEKEGEEEKRTQHHQMVMLLMRMKSERDELMCQNESMHKILRGLPYHRSTPANLLVNARETLKRSANYDRGDVSADKLFGPISKSIVCLQDEMRSLNNAMVWGSSGEMSLLDELRAAIAGEEI